MENELDHFYLKQTEPNQSCFLALRDIILGYDTNITPAWKYKLPFFLYKGKMFCYLWQDKKTKIPYIGFVNSGHFEHPQLEIGNRKKMKTLSINPTKDIDLEVLIEILTLSKQVEDDKFNRKNK